MTRIGIKKLIAFCLMLCVLAVSSVLPAFAENDGEDHGGGYIEVTFNRTAVGIGVELFEVGTYSYDTGKITLNESFSGCELPSDTYTSSSNAKEFADSLVYYAFENDCEGIETRVDLDGKAVFDGLSTENKVYVIGQTSDFAFIQITNIILVLPYRSEQYTTPTTTVRIKGKSVDDMGVNYKGAVILNKKDNRDVPLEGAEFILERKVYYTTAPDNLSELDHGKDSGGTYYWKEYLSNLVTNDKGQIVIEKLPFLTYRFVETKAPDGYALNSEPAEFVIDKYSTVRVENDVYVAGEGSPAIISFVNVPFEESSEPSEPVESSEPESGFEDSDESGNIESSEPEISSPYSKPEQSTPESPVSGSEGEISQSSGDAPIWQITGDDIIKYVIIGSIVAVSLVVVILLVVLSGKKRKK